MADWDGAEYRRVNSVQQWLADRALRNLELDGVRDLLDVGCGDGLITAQIAARLPDARVIGLDPSPRMIAIAPQAAGLTFELGEVTAMTFADRFDTVVSFNALHWVPDQRRALERIAAALHTAGRALLVFVCEGPRPSLEDVAMQATADPRWREHFDGFAAPYVHPEPGEWARLAGSLGLRVESTQVDDLTWDFGSRADFARWCTVGFGAWTDRLPGTVVTDFVSDVVTRYESIAGAPGRFRFLQFRAALARTPVA